MDHVNHFSFGLITPLTGYFVMFMAAAIGLRCTVRALHTSGPAKRTWLLVGATAIGAGIWTLHFIAMLGFTVDGSAIRYDVPLTLLSLVVAIGVVSAGVFTVGYSKSASVSLPLGGLGAGLGVAAMHYTGMAAVQISGIIAYNRLLVAMSIVIAIVAASAALWIVLRVHGFGGALGAALVMGLAVSGMHYTAMAAVRVELVPDLELSGATSTEFLFPLTVGIGAVLFITFTFLAVSPIEEEAGEARAAEQLRALASRREQYAKDIENQILEAERHPAPKRRRPTNPSGTPPSR